MPVSQLEKLFNKAQKGKWAIGHFNISDFKMLIPIFQAAKKLKSPVIIGMSERRSKRLGLKKAISLVRKLREENSFPVFLNLDHGKSFIYIKKAIDAGYDAVHFDGSDLPLLKNISIARQVVRYANKKNVLVEGEVGVIGGELTEPKDAKRFIKETGVDTLAVSVGTIHGIVKLGKKNPPISLKRLREIKKKTGKMPLVLHGGSGTPDKDIKAAVKSGVVKININTELQIAYKTKGLKAVQRVVEKKINLFGSNNKIHD